MRAWLARRLNTVPEMVETRLAWLLWRQWMSPVWLWYRRRTCQEHVPVVGFTGKVEMVDGEPRGKRLVFCAYCLRPLRNLDE